eukprot:ctg_1139.g401
MRRDIRISRSPGLSRLMYPAVREKVDVRRSGRIVAHGAVDHGVAGAHRHRRVGLPGEKAALEGDGRGAIDFDGVRHRRQFGTEAQSVRGAPSGVAHGMNDDAAGQESPRVPSQDRKRQHPGAAAARGWRWPTAVALAVNANGSARCNRDRDCCRDAPFRASAMTTETFRRHASVVLQQTVAVRVPDAVAATGAPDGEGVCVGIARRDGTRRSASRRRRDDGNRVRR